MQIVTVPATVKEIYENAFAGSALYSITLSGVEYIDDAAFADCENLANVTLPNTLSEVGEYAFQNCSALLNIDLNGSIITLPEGLFAGCTWLTEIGLPNSLETISTGAFRDCVNLKAIDFGASVSEIAADAFEGCGGLTSFSVAGGNSYYKAVDGVLFNKSGKQLMLYPKGKSDASYAVPAGVTTIASNAMSDSRIKTLNLNSELTTLGAGALSGSSLLEMIGFNTTLSTIGANAFDGCINLREVTLPESVNKVGAEAFDMTGLTRIYIPAQTELGRNAIPELDGLTIYGHRGSEAEIYANSHGIRFIDTSGDVEVTGISIPETLALEPGSSATLEATLLPANTTETTVLWSSDNETIVVVSDSGVVTARSTGTAVITAMAANGASAVCEVTIARAPVIATSISLSETAISMNIGDVRSVSATVLPINADDIDVTWSIEDTSIASWFKGNVVGVGIGETVLTAATSGGLTATCSIVVKPAPIEMGTPDFTLPNALETIEAEAFTGLPMTIVKCPDGLKSIQSRAFANCNKLIQIYIPKSVTSIASDAFSGCNNEMIIYGQSGSTAESFANAQGFVFAVFK